jgi:hypothetical protein
MSHSQTKEGQTVFYHTEAKPQGWRALAIFEDGSECLIYVGRSTTQVRAGYREAYMELLDEDERAQVQKVSLQCWDGAPDRGRWVPKTTLAIPDRSRVAVDGARQRAGVLGQDADDEVDDQEEAILPFRKPAAAKGEDAPQRQLEDIPHYVAPTA